MIAPAAPIALYEGVVVHRRSADVAHRFRQRVWMPVIDLDRLDEIRSLWPLWSSRYPAILRHRRADFGGRSAGANPDPRPLAGAMRDLVEERTGVRPLGHVHLMAHARTWGWLFNPLAVYYCHDDEASPPVAAVLEVTSTPWGERTHYVLDLRAGPELSRTVRKLMHVSPFLSRDLDYDISLSTPGERCSVSITARSQDGVVFAAALSLRRSPASRRRLLGMLVRHPLLTHRVSIGIYAHALRLRRAGAGYIPRTGVGADR